ncbi:MAG: S8 family serine peptidase, partial [Bdellovibrionaceae bacterium]|nr:S8 family serine peptidase [Pseudobdellovibrionaceae bacterium]
EETLSKSEAKYYPACLSHDPRFKKLIVVGSVDIDNKNNIEGKSKFSNYSPEYVHIAAPGNSPLGGLYSTISSNKYGWKAGTSQATPLVTSAVALTYAILNQPRTTINDQTQTVFDKCKINEKNRPEVIKKIILDSATKRNDMISYWKDGNVLNLSKLIDYIHLIFPDTKKN